MLNSLLCTKQKKHCVSRKFKRSEVYIIRWDSSTMKIYTKIIPKFPTQKGTSSFLAQTKNIWIFNSSCLICTSRIPKNNRSWSCKYKSANKGSSKNTSSRAGCRKSKSLWTGLSRTCKIVARRRKRQPCLRTRRTLPSCVICTRACNKIKRMGTRNVRTCHRVRRKSATGLIQTAVRIALQFCRFSWICAQAHPTPRRQCTRVPPCISSPTA